MRVSHFALVLALVAPLSPTLALAQEAPPEPAPAAEPTPEFAAFIRRVSEFLEVFADPTARGDDELAAGADLGAALLNDPALPGEARGPVEEALARIDAERKTRAERAAAPPPEPQPEAMQEAAPQPEPQADPQAEPVQQESAPQPEPQADPQTEPMQEAAPQPTQTPLEAETERLRVWLEQLGDPAALDDGTLAARLAEGREFLGIEGLPQAARRELRLAVRALADETERRQVAAAPQPTPEPAQPAEPAPPGPETAQETGEPAAPQAPLDAGLENRAVEQPVVSSEAEARAAVLLADTTDGAALDEAALRKRLEAARDLLEAGDLSRETERALRERLRTDREVLRLAIARGEAEAAERARVAAEQARSAEQAAAPAAPAVPGNNSTVNNTTINNTTVNATTIVNQLLPPPLAIAPVLVEERPVIVADRRPPTDLDDADLFRRMQTYSGILADPDVPAEQRLRLRQRLAADRAEMRERLRAQREERVRLFDDEETRATITLSLRSEPRRAPPPSVIFAAEEDEDEIVRQLSAPPLRPIPQRVSRRTLAERPDEVIARPEVRRLLPGIELDTVRFGFNEAIVREEEIPNLDKIGRSIERIVASRPNEVFVIEGHTDAVGSDAYNLRLSRQRAAAVREALLEFYVIEPRNVVTVGLGERYLKIPTPDEEPENRRVTVRRVTELVGN